MKISWKKNREIKAWRTVFKWFDGFFLVILSLTDDVPKWSLEMIAFIWQKICNLGFSQNMNLTSLIREFEMEAAAASGEGPTFRDFKKWKTIEKKVLKSTWENIIEVIWQKICLITARWQILSCGIGFEWMCNFLYLFFSSFFRIFRIVLIKSGSYIA